MSGTRTNEPAIKTTLENVAQELECPICLEISVPPIYQCTTGHIVCSSCRPSLTECGLCKAAFTGTRNYACEKLFETVGLRCKNAGEGCGELMLGEGLSTHPATCDFRMPNNETGSLSVVYVLRYDFLNTGTILGIRLYVCSPVQCQIRCCGKEVAYSKYLDHVKEVHKGKFESICTGLISKEYNGARHILFPIIIEFNGHRFLVWWECNNNLRFIRTQYFGRKKDAEKFRIKIVLESSENPKCNVMTWEGPPIYFRDKEEPCFMITQEGMERIFSGNKGVWASLKLRVTYEIKEVKVG